MHALSVSTGEFYKRAASVAEHYGFVPLRELSPTYEQTGMRDLGLETCRAPAPDLTQHVFKESIARALEQNSLPRKDPILFYTPLMVNDRTPEKRVSAFALNVIASRQPLAEVLILKAATAIVHEFGITGTTVRVNSIGDRDSSARFMREVSLILKRRIAELSDAGRELMRSDLHTLVQTLYQDAHPIVEEFPRTVEHLTAPSRKHFRDVLEYLDGTGLTYELDDRLTGSRALYAHTLFELVSMRDDGSRVVHGRGGRYDELTKTLARSSMPAVGIVLSFKTREEKSLSVRMRIARPKAILINIGTEARVRSFAVLEKFREARVPVEQCLQFERFSEQLAYAENKKTPFVVIMGQKEALEGVVIVRNALTRAQQTVPIDVLPAFFTKERLRTAQV